MLEDHIVATEGAAASWKSY